jgi:hypothetical protein
MKVRDISFLEVNNMKCSFIQMIPRDYKFSINVEVLKDAENSVISNLFSVTAE